MKFCPHFNVGHLSFRIIYETNEIVVNDKKEYMRYYNRLSSTQSVILFGSNKSKFTDDKFTGFFNKGKRPPQIIRDIWHITQILETDDLKNALDKGLLRRFNLRKKNAITMLETYKLDFKVYTKFLQVKTKCPHSVHPFLRELKIADFIELGEYNFKKYVNLIDKDINEMIQELSVVSNDVYNVDLDALYTVIPDEQKSSKLLGHFSQSVGIEKVICIYKEKAEEAGKNLHAFLTDELRRILKTGAGVWSSVNYITDDTFWPNQSAINKFTAVANVPFSNEGMLICGCPVRNEGDIPKRRGAYNILRHVSRCPHARTHALQKVLFLFVCFLVIL